MMSSTHLLSSDPRLDKKGIVNSRRFLSVLRQMRRLSNNRGLHRGVSSKVMFLRKNRKLARRFHGLLGIIRKLNAWEVYLRRFNPLQSGQLPNHHPHSDSGKNQWNKWLDNMNDTDPIIHQKVTFAARNVIDRMRHMYQAIWWDYSHVSLTLVLGLGLG
jgi:hypothetical protein